MSFDGDVIKPSRGRALRVDVSLDNFATVAYRYSNVAGTLDGTNQYEPRLLGMGAVRRAFGQRRIAASSSTSLRLANADGAIDWICGRANIADAAKARFRVYVTLYDPDASPLVFTSKQLGEFVLSSWPSRNNKEVTLNLADDFLGRLGAGLLLPTFADWQAVGTTSNNPFKNSIGLPSSINLNTPIQLAFGEDMLLAFPHIIPWGNNGTGETYEETVIVPLFCTTDLSAVDQELVTQVVADAYSFTENQGGTQFYTLPRNFYPPEVAATSTARTTWTVEKSPTITKGGIDFQIVYLVVREDLGFAQFQNVDVTLETSTPEAQARNLALLAWLRTFAYSGGYPVEAVDSTAQYPYVASRVVRWYVRASPKSQITNPPAVGGFGIAHAVDVVTDLVSVYSAATVDATSAARVKAGSPFAAASGVVQPWTERANNPSFPPPPHSLRQVLTELAQSSDFDIFLNWDGEIAFASDVMDFTTATQGASLIEVGESEINPGLRDWVPSDGERHAPFNRVYFEGGKPDPTSYEDVPFQGPFDLEDADIPTTARSIEVVLRQGWRPFRQQALDPWQWRSLDGVARARVKFSTHIGALRHELGNYFKLTWTRGPAIGGPYDGTIFQCESIAYSPDGDVVELEGIWRDDTQTERQYLLDDETLLVRSKGALTGNATFDASDSVSFDGTINLTTMGVEVGDILILRSSAEAADAFDFNAAYRISFIGTTTSIGLTGPGGVAPTLAGADVPNAEWSIVRGATTYPTAVSDPTNYPEGGSMYGKATAANGTTSDAEVGNRLISG